MVESIKEIYTEIRDSKSENELSLKSFIVVRITLTMVFLTTIFLSFLVLGGLR